jgi:amidophosphoribosyltransferase
VLATELRKPFSSAFIKNRYIFRTFILPSQKARQKGIRRKLSPIATEFKDKVVLLVDDSLVRGNTSREIVQMARESGARRVIFVSCSPGITHPHVHGIDLADPGELIAHGKTAEEVAKLIDADMLIYQDLDDLKEACREAGSTNVSEERRVADFEVGVFCGKYKTAVPQRYFEQGSRPSEMGKRWHAAAVEAERNGVTGGTLTASGGTVNGVSDHMVNGYDAVTNGVHKDPEHREDVR